MVLSEPPFAAAVGCHQAGDFRQAAARYRDILRQQPDHAGALHLLGVACQQEDLLEAATCIRRAIAIDGSKAVYHNNLGVVLRGQGRLSEATAAYRRALKINARYPDAMSNLATVWHEQGQHSVSVRVRHERRASGLTLEPRPSAARRKAWSRRCGVFVEGDPRGITPRPRTHRPAATRAKAQRARPGAREQRRRHQAMEAIAAMIGRFESDRPLAGTTAWGAMNAYTGWLQNDRI